jgi:hypothetical protein
MFSKKIIYGCEARGDAGSPYLTRYTLLSCRWFQLCVHVFHRSDSPELHDHPWNFWTLPLRHGYQEYVQHSPTDVRVHTVKPWRLYYRPATYAHRVLLHSVYDVTADALTVTKKEAVTLVLMTKRRREWGFFTRNGWQQWMAYFTERGC